MSDRMCGRITLTVPDIYRLMEEFPFEWNDQLAGTYRPSFNVAPSQNHPILAPTPEGPFSLEPAKWGLVPHWSKDPSTGLINARSETIIEKPSFRDAFLKRRCLVPADGFYEWKQEARGKQPYWFSLQSRGVFYFAGLYEEGNQRTFSILTTAAADWMKPIHERMPVIVSRDLIRDWANVKPLSKQEGVELLSSILGIQSSELEIRPVSLRVNSPKNNDASLIA